MDHDKRDDVAFVSRILVGVRESRAARTESVLRVRIAVALRNDVGVFADLDIHEHGGSLETIMGLGSSSVSPAAFFSRAS